MDLDYLFLELQNPLVEFEDLLSPLYQLLREDFVKPLKFPLRWLHLSPSQSDHPSIGE